MNFGLVASADIAISPVRPKSDLKISILADLLVIQPEVAVKIKSHPWRLVVLWHRKVIYEGEVSGPQKKIQFEMSGNELQDFIDQRPGAAGRDVITFLLCENKDGAPCIEGLYRFPISLRSRVHVNPIGEMIRKNTKLLELGQITLRNLYSLGMKLDCDPGISTYSGTVTMHKRLWETFSHNKEVYLLSTVLEGWKFSESITKPRLKYLKDIYYNYLGPLKVKGDGFSFEIPILKNARNRYSNFFLVACTKNEVENNDCFFSLLLEQLGGKEPGEKPNYVLLEPTNCRQVNCLHPRGLEFTPVTKKEP